MATWIIISSVLICLLIRIQGNSDVDFAYCRGSQQECDNICWGLAYACHSIEVKSSEALSGRFNGSCCYRDQVKFIGAVSGIVVGSFFLILIVLTASCLLCPFCPFYFRQKDDDDDDVPAETGLKTPKKAASVASIAK